VTTRGGFENCERVPGGCSYRDYTYDFCPVHDPEGAAAFELEESIQRARQVTIHFQWPRWVGAWLASKERYWDPDRGKRGKWRYRW
jgi:hypothetical protein